MHMPFVKFARAISLSLKNLDAFIKCPCNSVYHVYAKDICFNLGQRNFISNIPPTESQENKNKTKNLHCIGKFSD